MMKYILEYVFFQKDSFWSILTLVNLFFFFFFKIRCLSPGTTMYNICMHLRAYGTPRYFVFYPMVDLLVER